MPAHMVWMIGNFDGLHKGHQALIALAKQVAGDKPIALLTFEPHPKRFFNPNLPLERIFSFSEKLRLLAVYGVDYCYAMPFNADLANMSAENFCHQIIYGHLKASHVVVGHDFCFGKNRTGTTALLQTYGQKYGFDTHILSQQSLPDSGLRYSSSLLRSLLKQGDMQQARNILGHDYTLSGHVMRGKQIARTLGFPTANVRCQHLLLPALGVYQGKALVGEKIYPAIANIGVKPTITDGTMPLLEVHIPHFSQMIYGKKIRFIFEKMIRSEQKFLSLESLKHQIEQDILRLETI